MEKFLIRKQLMYVTAAAHDIRVRGVDGERAGGITEGRKRSHGTRLSSASEQLDREKVCLLYFFNQEPLVNFVHWFSSNTINKSTENYYPMIYYFKIV